MEKNFVIILNEKEKNALLKVAKKELKLLNTGLVAFKFESNRPLIEVLQQAIEKLNN